MNDKELEIQKYRNILKHRNLTPEENDKYTELVYEKIAEQSYDTESYSQISQNMNKGIQTCMYDTVMGQRLPTRKEFIDKITEKGIMGKELTTDEKEFLHVENQKHMISEKDSIERLEQLEKHQKKYGPTSVVFLPHDIMNPETEKPVTTLSEYIELLRKHIL